MMTEILYPPDKETGPAIRQEELARQVLFHVANLPRETHPRLVMAQFVRLARWLLGDLNPNSITAALEPYLDAEDPDLVAATQWLMYVGDVMKSDRGYRTEPAFGLVRDFYLRGDPGRSEDKLPTWVIEWMYKADPPAAMNTYLQAFGLGGSGGNAARARGSIGAVKHAQLRVENHVALKLAGALAMRPPQAGAPEAAAEVEPGTIEALRDLATTEQWWVRLYVVATMAKHLELRDPALLRRLAKDEHEYVRKAVAGIDDDERQP